MSNKKKEEFKLSIDGRSFDERDPRNFNAGYKKGTAGDHTYNRHANDMTNPLYDYSYGTVRDAAKAVGIKNVDEKKEVNSILDYIQNPKTEEPKPQELVEKQPTNKDNKPKTYTIDLRKDTEEADAIIERYNQGALGSVPLTGQSINRFAGVNDKALESEFLADYSLNLRRTSGMGTRGQITGSTTVVPDATSAPVLQSNPTSDEFKDRFKDGIKSNLVRLN